MVFRLFGCGTFLVGLVFVYLSMHADEYGLGDWKGVGEGDLLFTLLGLLVAGVGVLMAFAPRDPRVPR